VIRLPKEIVMDAFVITFREGLEAAVAVGVIAGYLAVVGQKSLMRWVYAGVIAAVAASLAGGIALRGAADVVENPAFEGAVYLTAAVFVTSMVVWMWRTGRRAATRIRESVDSAVNVDHNGWRAFALFLVSFLLVAREGIETALFLVASSLGESSSASMLVGGVLGVVAALGIAIVIIKGSEKVDLRLFFGATSVVLVVLAVRFFAAGIAELSEAGLLPAAHSIEEALETVSHGLGNPWVMGALVLVPIATIGWALVKNRTGHTSVTTH
jgi:high-affinity iron transporter